MIAFIRFCQLIVFTFVAIIPHFAYGQPPTTQPDIVNTNQTFPVTFSVTENDSDATSGINPASVDLLVATPDIDKSATNDHGTYSVDIFGAVTFTPVATFFGTTTLNYTVQNNAGETSSPTLITVHVNALPVAQDDTGETDANTETAVDVTLNDYDPDGTIDKNSVDMDPSTPGVQASFSNGSGTYAVMENGIVKYTPAASFTGTASITYTVNDNSGATSNIATVTIIVNAVNNPPVANNDAAVTDEDVAVSISILDNDTDDGTIDPGTVDLNPGADGIQNTITIPEGTFSVNASGVVTYTPASNFNGNASVTYTVNDSQGATSNTATITVTVNPVNDPPVANHDAASTTMNQPVSVNVVANDTDDNGINAASVDLNTSVDGIQNAYVVSEGAFVVNTAGVVSYSPTLNYTGTVSITYTVNDNGGATSNNATITIQVLPGNDPPVNKSPVANNDAASTAEETPVTINVLANDTDADGTINPATVDLDPNTEGIQNTISSASGTFETNAQGMVTFTPAANFYGNVSTSYRVSDNAGAASNAAVITITVNNVNDPPFFDVIPDQRRHRNAIQKIITITGISPGPLETEHLNITATSANATLLPNPVISYNGTATVATLTFKPNLNQSGTTEVTVKATDQGSLEFSRTFLVEVQDARITSTPGTVAVIDQPYEYLIQTTEIPDALVDESLTIVAAQKPAWLALTSTGTYSAKLSGTPPGNAVTSVVQLQFRDGAAIIDQQDFTLTINHPPVVRPIAEVTDEDIVVPFSEEKFTAAYSDADNHPLTEIQFTVLPRHGELKLNTTSVTTGQAVSISSIGQVSYYPAKDYAGQDTLQFKASDGYSYSTQSAIMHFVIHPVNDPPEIITLETEPLPFDIGKEVAQKFTTTFQAVDVDGDKITGAEIGFRKPNFNAENDVLEFINTDKIKGVYDSQFGILTLTGEATDVEYSEAIRSIKYNYTNLKDIVTDPRVLYVTLSDGKSVSDAKERSIQLVYTFTPLDIPNVFTPDGNGTNDFWEIREKGREGRELVQYDDALIRIFSKRGELVFETVGFEKKWDGTFKGKSLPVGTYFYTIDLNYGKVRYRGTVTLLRAR